MSYADMSYADVVASDVSASRYELERWVSELPEGARSAFHSRLLQFETLVRIHEQQLPPRHQRDCCEVCGQGRRPEFADTPEIHPECGGAA